MALPPCKLVTWTEIDRWVSTLADKIAKADRVPETIVALTRGGWVPARLIADRLGVKHMVAVRAQHWGVTATPDGQAEITEGLGQPLTGRTVLVVDDITDTGQSMELAARHVGESHPRRLESAALLHLTRSTYVPTYYAEEIPEGAWAWFIFPWNYWEDIGNLANRAASADQNALGIQRLLKEQAGIAVNETDLRIALKRT